MDLRNTWSQWPDSDGRFGEFGGRYVAETLMPLILDLEPFPHDLTVHLALGRNIDDEVVVDAGVTAQPMVG